LINTYSSNTEILKKTNVVPVEKAKGIVVGLTLLKGKLETHYSITPALRDLPVCTRLGFPEVISPGLSRNDFYVTVKFNHQYYLVYQLCTSIIIINIY